MKMVKDAVIVLAAIGLVGFTPVHAQQPGDFIDLLLSAEGEWNNLTYGTTGPIWLSGEVNATTHLFTISATTPGAFGVPDTTTYELTGVFLSYADSIVISISTPWPGGLLVEPDTVYGSVAVPEFGIVVQVTGTYGENSANLEYQMTGAFQATGTLELTAAPTTGVPEEPAARRPESFHLSQNFLNPFNSETVIPFTLPSSGYVKLTVYDILGNQAAVLANGFFPQGNHQVRFNGKDVPSGVYFYRLEAGRMKSVRKMILTE